jgi:SOS response regulatory protein OraA/RecX
MGEVLQFPGNRGGEGPSTGSEQQEGVERRSAPSRRRAAPRHPAAQRTLEDLERLAGVEARRRAEAALPPAHRAAEDDEPGWAVPGVDEPSAPAPEPTRATRRAENVAIAALTRHDASEGEIRAKLLAKGLEEADVESELERLRRAGLVDDVAFARRVVDRSRDRKGLGDQAIRMALRARKVPVDVIDAVLVDQEEDAETAEARLQEVADDRARRLGSLPYDVAERRLTAYLMRKGYSGSAVRSAARAALEGAGIR